MLQSPLTPGMPKQEIQIGFLLQQEASERKTMRSIREVINQLQELQESRRELSMASIRS